MLSRRVNYFNLEGNYMDTSFSVGTKFFTLNIFLEILQKHFTLYRYLLYGRTTFIRWML